MKSFRFLGIVLCAFVGISTYNANGMDTPRPKSNSFVYNKVNRINIIENNVAKIKNSAEFLKSWRKKRVLLQMVVLLP